MAESNASFARSSFEEPRSRGLPQAFARGARLAALTAGLLALAALISGAQGMDVFGALTTAPLSWALLSVALGCSIAGAPRWVMVLSQAFATFAVAIAAVALVEHFGGPRVHSTVGWFPARMSFLDAIDISLVGIATGLVDVETPRGRRPAQFLALAACVASLAAVVGYAWALPMMQGAAPLGTLSMPAAVACALLAAGVL